MIAAARVAGPRLPAAARRLRRRAHRRGVSLLASLIVVGVLVILVSVAVSFTGRERQSAAQHLRREALTGCVQSARNLVVSQLRGGAAGSSMALENVRGESTTGEYHVRTGHLDDDTPGGGPGVSVCASDADSQAWGSMDLTNTVVDPNAPRPGSGRCYAVVASCEDRQTRGRREVEFQLRIAF